MNILCKATTVAFIVALSVSITYGQRCNGGVECIPLNDCTGLYNQLRRGATPQLTQLLRGLHCGFQGENPMFVNTGLPSIQKTSTQRVQRPKTKAKNQKVAVQESNIFDLGFWGFPTMKPTMKPVKKKSPSKPKITPTSKPKVKPAVRPTPKPALKPAIRRTTTRPTFKPTNRPAIKSTVKLTVQTPVNQLAPARRKICCPPHFQGNQDDGSSTSASSGNEGSNGGGGGWNRGGPIGNSNGGNGGSNSNSNNANGWDRGGVNSNGGGSTPTGGGGFSSDPTSLLPNKRECGIQNNDRIVGGTRADIDEHPWMALLRYDKPVGWGFYCGGVLISSRYILTAAHCVKGDDLPTNWRLSQVRLGEWNTSSVNDCLMDDCTAPVQDVPIEETIAHEQYDPQDQHQHNDIALLRLAQPVQYNDFVKPICLPLSKDMKNNGFDGYTMEVAGWGKTESRSESEVKLKVNVPVVSRSECARVFSRVGREIINKQLCAGGLAGKDSCRGDSGGALMGRVPTAENWFVMGVVSYGPSPCGTPGWPGVYTRVGAYIDWMLSKIRP